MNYDLLPQVIRIDDKALKIRSLDDSQARNELAHAATLRAMNHEHLTAIFDVCLHDNKVHTWMTWNGVDLFDYAMKNESIYSGALFHAVYTDIRAALQYMHVSLNCCHGDVKLENIMCPGSTYLNTKYKLCDFGSIVPQTSPLIPNNKVVGTDHYRAPELFYDKLVDYRKADLWSFGVALFCLHFRRFLNPVAIVKSNYLWAVASNEKLHFDLTFSKHDHRTQVPSLGRYKTKVLASLLMYLPGDRYFS